jgi:hypothetical protein
MEDVMKNLTKTTETLRTWTKILNYWTIVTIVILVGLVVGHFLDSLLFPQLVTLIGSSISLVFIVIPFLGVFLIKDTQLQILLSLIRGLLGFILPLALMALTLFYFPTNLMVLALFVVLFVVGLIISVFLFIQVLALNKFTKQLLMAATK